MVQSLLRKSAGLMLLLCSLSLLTVLTSGCQEAKLKAVIKIANKQCPLDMGEAGKITSIVYDGENVVYSFHVNEKITDIEILRNNPESMKLSMETMFRNPAPDVKKMLDLMVECNAGLQMIFIGQDPENRTTCELTAAEIKKVLNTDTDVAESNRAKLESQIKMANLQFPMKASEDITIEKMELSDESVIYICRVDENLSDIGLIKENAATVKQNIISELSKQTDPATRLFIQTCINCNKNIAYRYIGNKSGVQYDMIITTPELNEMITKK